MLKLPRLPFLLLTVMGLGFFVTGVLVGKFMLIAACPLCILQRMTYLLTGLLGLPALVLADRPWARRGFAVVLTATSALGAFIAAYQTWLQLHPEGPSCSANSPWWEDFVFWAGQQAPDLFMSNGMCTDPGFTLFGLSIANYSLLLFSAMTLIGLYGLWRGWASR